MIIKLKYVCFITLIFISINSKAQEQVKEVIKDIIENASNKAITIDTQIIHCKESLINFYKNRLYEPAWNSNGKIKSLTKELNKADEEGLNPNDYHFEKIIDLTKKSPRSIIEEAQLDLLSSDAILLYASHLLTGKVDQENNSPRWTVPIDKKNLLGFLERSILSNSIQSSIENIKPKHEVYVGLKIALEKYIDYKEDGGWQSIPKGISIKLGMKDSTVLLIRKRLYATKELPKRLLNNSNTYDEKLYEAVKKFQQRHGIEPNGDVNKKTLLCMNVSVDARIDQIKLNLERWRWYSSKLKSFYILINIPDFTLEVIKNDKRERLHKVIVGRTDRKTAVFSSKITNLIFNPTWTVPPGILRKDILPSVRKNVNYLKSKNISVYNSKGVILNPKTINFYGSTAKSYSYVQAPGPSNALGAVKFILPNKYSIYLHDTPNKELFKESQRTFSSGCIRVQNPIELAEYLLNDPELWNLEKINNIINTKKTPTVPITNQPEIHVLYWTTWTDNDGIIQFRNDIYNKDIELIKAIHKPPHKFK